MSDRKLLRLPAIDGRKERRGEVNRDLLTSQMSNAAAQGHTLPENGAGRTMKARNRIVMTDNSKAESVHFPTLVPKVQPQAKPSRCPSASKREFEKLPVLPAPPQAKPSRCPSASRREFVKLPAVAKQACSNKEESQQDQDRVVVPTRLVPMDHVPRKGSARHNTKRAPAELNAACKLPDIKSTQDRCPRPQSGDQRKPPCRVLPPIAEKKEDAKGLKLPPIDNKQRSGSPILEKRRKMNS